MISSTLLYCGTCHESQLFFVISLALTPNTLAPLSRGYLNTLVEGKN